MLAPASSADVRFRARKRNYETDLPTSAGAALPEWTRSRLHLKDTSMSPHLYDSRVRLRRLLLAASVANALVLSSSSVHADGRAAVLMQGPGGSPSAALAPPPYLVGYEAHVQGSTPKRPASSHAVANCNESGPGSLSAVIADPTTVSGDVIDLTPLK